MGVLCSGDMAEQYASPIKRIKNPKTIREPLGVLCEIGIIERTARAVCAHVQVSARYQITKTFAGRMRRMTISLNPKMRAKLVNSEERRDHRLNRKYPFRKKLLSDLTHLAFAETARPMLARLRKAGNGGSGLDKITHAIDTQAHAVKVNTLGTIYTALSSLPCKLKPNLTLCGEAVVICDISHTHHCFLPLLFRNRIDHFKSQNSAANISALEAERTRLIQRLSEGDYYQSWCVSASDNNERAEIKNLANTLLNMATCRCSGIPLYRRMSGAFPHTFQIIEDIKRNDHRNLSKQLQRFTSTAINGALLQLQREGIAVIPDTDSLICRAKDQSRVCGIIGQHVFEVSAGVRCNVSGIRYAPTVSECWPNATPASARRECGLSPGP